MSKLKKDAHKILETALHWGIGEHAKKEVINLLAERDRVAREEAIKECIELSDKIELREPDGGTRQWMAFKAFRNEMRERLNTLPKPNITSDKTTT